MTRGISFEQGEDGNASLRRGWRTRIVRRFMEFPQNCINTTSGWGRFRLTPQVGGARICGSARSFRRISGRQLELTPQGELEAAEGVQNDHDAGLHRSVCQSTM